MRKEVQQISIQAEAKKPIKKEKNFQFRRCASLHDYMFKLILHT